MTKNYLQLMTKWFIYMCPECHIDNEKQSQEFSVSFQVKLIIVFISCVISVNIHIT